MNRFINAFARLNRATFLIRPGPIARFGGRVPLSHLPRDIFILYRAPNCGKYGVFWQKDFFWLGRSQGICVEISLASVSFAWGYGWGGRKGLGERAYLCGDYGWPRPPHLGIFGFVFLDEHDVFGGNVPTHVNWTTFGLPVWLPIPFLFATPLTRIRRKLI